ncbi:hypothetical protein [Clavibacter californiensis]|jgi:hypothetical protein|uniref:Uncharacterized protein n=1 Tax=Clavibacter californiensis TaxID=1401995 RepID=A0ABX9N634_9MICO|nr:hypothetical protein [Clavibacter californiensis]PPF59429.1 hypothetical protein C5C13_06730 [Clavibacter michiganensis]RII89212.1 hypothetical protein DZF98_14635 [Clavibacter californiensis]UKF80437.1 hypothetical protein FGD68_01945 [Clavibacter californiensis]
MDEQARSQRPGEAQTTDDDESIPDAHAMYALMEDQRRVTIDAQTSFVWVMHLSWGVAWILGYLALWSIDGSATFSLETPVAAGIFATLIGTASVISIIVGVRSGSGVKVSPASAWQSRVYGISWSAAMIAVYMLGAGLIANGMSGTLTAVYFTSAFALAAGLMLLSTAALFHSRSSLLLGSILLASAVVAPFAGYPGTYLVMALVGGGGYLVTGTTLVVQASRVRRRLRAHHA